MPLVKITVSVSVDESKKKEMLKQLSHSIAEKLAKPEKYVQTVFEAGIPMTFAGTFAPAASLEPFSLPSGCEKTYGFRRGLEIR